METIKEFLGTNELSKTSIWLKTMYESTPAAVEEFIIIAKDAGFKTIGHVFAQRNHAAHVIQRVLELGHNPKNFADILYVPLEKVQIDLEYAFKFREGKLMDIEVITTDGGPSNNDIQNDFSSKMQAQWKKIMDTPLSEIFNYVKKGWKYDMARA